MADAAPVSDFAIPAKSNPFRPPEWRWLAAGDYAGRPRNPATRRSTDAGVLAAFTLQEDLAGSTSPAGMAAALALHGPTGRAYQLWAAGQLGPHTALLTAELEGYILAGLDDAEIGSRLGLSASIVAAYHLLFFDVRSRIDNSGWISIAAIGPLQDAPASEVATALVRAYGYYLKSADVVRAMARTVQLAGSTDDLYDTVIADTKLALAVKASLAARTVEPHKAFRSVLEMQLKHLEHVSNVAPGGDGQQKYTTALDGLAEQTVYTVGASVESREPEVIEVVT